MKPKLLLSVAASAALIAMAATAAVGATPHKYPSAIVIDGLDPHYFTPIDGGRSERRAPNAFNFYGRLETPKGKCLAGRGVDLYFVRSGADRKMGHTSSDSNGGWSQMTLLEDTELGDYYAKLLKRKLPNGDICKADRSPVYTTGGG